MARPPLLPVEDALALAMGLPLALSREQIPCTAARGRILADPLLARLPSPHWDNSAMDGIAVRAADLAGVGSGDGGCDAPVGHAEARVRLRVTGTIAAGHAPAAPVEPGTCMRIMTGAPMPAGADAVVMRERVEADPSSPDHVLVPRGVQQGRHVRRAAEEFDTGALLLAAGSRLGGPSLGLLAAQGHAAVTVWRRPRVAILATGDELVPPGQALGPGQIHASNTAALMGLAAEAGAEAIDCGVARDGLDDTRAALERALGSGPDLLLTTGGVSVGDFDHVRTAMGQAGMDLSFYKVRMKPGKPLAVGTIGGVPCFGLPGNPVSAMVCFLQFVRPLLLRAQGVERPFLPVVDAVLKGSIRRRAGRAEFVRVALEWSPDGLGATPLHTQSSGTVASMARADGLALLDHRATEAQRGDVVSVQLLRAGAMGGAQPNLRWGGRWSP